MRINQPGSSPTFLKKTTNSSSSSNNSSVMMNPYGRLGGGNEERNEYAVVPNNSVSNNRRGLADGRFKLLKKQNSVRFQSGDTSWQRNPSSRNLLRDAQKESYRDLLKLESEQMNKSVSFANDVICNNNNSISSSGGGSNNRSVSFALDIGDNGGDGDNTRLEKSAIKLQRFFRRCLLVLRQFGDDFHYLNNEIQDIETRRVEELQYVAKFIEEEKEQFRMQLEEEYNANLMSPEEWEAYHKEKDDTNQEIERLKEENEQLKRDCKEMQRTNNQLSIVDPEREAERNRLEMEVQKLELDERDWKNIKERYEIAVNEARRKLGLLEDNQRIKRDHRKRMEFAIGRVIELLEESNQRDANPKLVEKVEKLKTRREKKMKKLKAKTKAAMQENQGRIPTTTTTTTTEAAEADQQQQQEEAAEVEKQQRKARRKSSRKQRQQETQGDDIPEMVDGTQASPDAEAAAEEKQKSKEKRRSKKKKDQQLDDLPDMVTVVEGDNSQDADNDSDEKDAKKKKKKKDKKDKDKDKKDKKKRSSTVEDEAFMKMYEAEARKKAAKKLEDSNNGSEPGALMALITG